MSRSLSLLALALLIVGCGQAASLAPSPSASAPAASAPSAAVRVADFKITPIEVRVAAGALSLAVANDGPTPHNLTIRDAGGVVVAFTPEIRPGGTETLSGTVSAGMYVLFCSLPGHESLGMRAMLVVGS